MQNDKVKALAVISTCKEGIKIVNCLVGIARGDFTVTYIYDGATYTIWGEDWHRTPEDAIARAEEMRAAKIASLKKQISRLEKLEFKV